MLYFDANATTPCAPEVQEAMRPYWSDAFANASSPHRAGRVAAQAVAAARRSVAECLDAHPQEIIFTSGATESTNLVFWGLLLAPRTRRHVVVSAIEHKAVLESAALLEEQGFEVTRLPVTPDGVVDLDAAARAITPETALVSVQAANNEIGTIQPVLQISRLAHEVGAFFHVDAVQALGKMPVSMLDWECDFASFSAHKIYGPKGVGVLFVKGGPLRWPWPRPLRGGGQEGGLQKVSGSAYTLSLRAAESVAVTAMVDTLPPEYVREKVSREPDKTAIKADLKSGKTIPGCDLVTTYSLQIR